MMVNSRQRALKVLCAGLLGLMVLPGCSRDHKFSPVDMWNRSRLKPYEPVNFFADGNSSRPIPPGTIARGQLRTDDAAFRGTQNGRFVAVIPTAMTAGVSSSQFLLRGQERYNIYCLPCHGASGYGDGMIVKRGFAPPPDYRIARLRNAPVGHFYDVITNGYGAMYSYAGRVPPRDRWAISAYIQELQRLDTKVVPDVRYTDDPRRGTKDELKNGTGIRNGTNQPGLVRPQGGNAQAGPVGGTGSISSPAPNNPQMGTGSTSRAGQPDMPSPKTPTQALPATNPTPGSDGTTRHQAGS
jgi:hypothetical protein